MVAVQQEHQLRSRQVAAGALGVWFTDVAVGVNLFSASSAVVLRNSRFSLA